MTSQTNLDVFVTMLTALGIKDYDTFEAALAPDVLLEWPFVPMEGFPEVQTGARWFRDVLEVSWADFDPYNYRIEVIHDLADPNRLIAEYSSHSRYIPADSPYSNRYIAVLDFADGKITRWREYVNPMVIARVMGVQSRWAGEGG
jgi:ketosteroid isomerase-like protein